MPVINASTLQVNLTARDAGWERTLRRGAQQASNLGTKSRKAATDMNRVGRSAKQSGVFVSRYGTQMRGAGRASDFLAGKMRALGGAIALAFGARAIARFGKSAVEAFGEQEKAVESLRAALVATGKSASSIGLITAEASRLQSVTTAADEALIGASATLASLAPNLNTADLARAQGAIVGIADTFLKGDISNAALLIGKSIGSTTNALTRYGVQIDVNATQQEKLNQLIAQSGTFLTIAEAKADTLTGRITQLNNAWGDFKEVIGELLVDGIELQTFIEKATGKIKGFAQAVSTDAGVAFQNAGFLLGAKLGAGIFGGIAAALRAVSGPLTSGIANNPLTAGLGTILDEFGAGAIVFERLADLANSSAEEAADNIQILTRASVGYWDEQRTAATRAFSAIQLAGGALFGLPGVPSRLPAPAVAAVETPAERAARIAARDKALNSADFSVPLRLTTNTDTYVGVLEAIRDHFTATPPLVPVNFAPISAEEVEKAAKAATIDLSAARKQIADELAIKQIGLEAGNALVDGLIQGSLSAGDILKSAIKRLISHFVLSPLFGALNIGSPSKVTKGVGINIGQGLVVGMRQIEPAVRTASASLADAVAAGLPDPNLAFSSDITNVNNSAITVEPANPTINITIPSMFADPATEARTRGSQEFIREGIRVARDGGFR